jgi:tetratricopeptide (TPR) repeat protein
MGRFAAVLVLVFTFGLPVWGQWTDDADRCSKISDPDQSLPYCTAAIESGHLSTTNLAITFNNRGNAYAHNGNHDRAIRDYDEAIRLNPGYAAAFYDRGLAYRLKGAYDRAIQDYDEAIRLSPNFVGALNNRGRVYTINGDYDRAIQDYDEAIRLSPNYQFAFYNRGYAYQEKGDYAHAIEDYDQAIRLNPNDAEAFKDRGGAYSKTGNNDRAIEDYDQAIRLNPRYADALNDRGRLRFYLGQFVAAQPDFARALELDSSDTERALWLYLARSRAGQDARNELEKNGAQLKLTELPGPVTSLYLGKATAGGFVGGCQLRGEDGPSTTLRGLFLSRATCANSWQERRSDTSISTSG